MQTGRTVDILLRLGVALAFLYPALNAVFDPYAWVGYFPAFVRDLGPEMLILHVFGLVEVVIALWILSGQKVFVPSVIAAAMLFLIVLTNLSDFQVLFRDVPIAFMALALAAMHRPGRAHA